MVKARSSTVRGSPGVRRNIVARKSSKRFRVLIADKSNARSARATRYHIIERAGMPSTALVEQVRRRVQDAPGRRWMVGATFVRPRLEAGGAVARPGAVGLPVPIPPETADVATLSPVCPDTPGRART